MAVNHAVFMRKARRLVASFIPFVLAVSTLSAISVVTAPEALASTNVTATGTNPAVCNQTVSTPSTVTATRVDNDCVVTFVSGTNSWTVPAGVTSVTYLIVGGGGGGSGRHAGGGGAGGFIEGTASSLSGAYTIVVGAGGSGSPRLNTNTSTSSSTSQKGGNSSITGNNVSVTSVGGGAGAGRGQPVSVDDRNGGSGGGSDCGLSSCPKGTGTAGQGFGGGQGVGGEGLTWSGGGGGGAGGAGGAATSGVGGNGGAGKSSSISGVPVTYAGGGGGATFGGTSAGSGGSGGGGNGGNGAAGSNATGFGSGGGGGGHDASVWAFSGGNGSSGIVVVRYTAPPVFPSNSAYGTASENETLSLSAPTGNVFTSIQFSSYGTPNNYIQGSCHAAATSQITTAFLGKNSGSIFVSNANLGGDPCSGTGKRLSVILLYGPPFSAPSITSITPGDTTLSVAFTAATSNASNSAGTITRYQYSTNGGTNWRDRDSGTTASPLVINTTSLASPVTLVNGTAYSIRIRAVNSEGIGTESSITTGTPSFSACSPTTNPNPPAGFTVISFTTVTTCNWTVPNGVTRVDVLAVGGGGAGGSAFAGAAGGGGGGQVTVQENATVSGVLTIQIGSGGVAQSTAGTTPGGNGGTTSVTPASGGAIATASGGSGGASVNSGSVGIAANTGFNGGGGGAQLSVASTNGTSGVGGNSGGTGNASNVSENNQSGGGGGGSGGSGVNATTTSGGAGGLGTSNSFTGSAIVYGGGGGGGKRTGTGAAGLGGSGVGGAGGLSTTGSAGTSNRGGGGGGAGESAGGGTNAGGAGGSGVVVVRYVNAPVISLSTSTIAASVGTAVTSYEITQAGGTVASYSIPSADSTAITAVGLSFSTSTGLISGSPTGTLASRSITITATNSSGTSTASFTLSSNLPACVPANASPGSSGFTTLVFTNSAPCIWSVPSGVTTASLLVVGGGGGGGDSLGGQIGGTGGAGGFFSSNTVAISGTITVRAGAGGSAGQPGNNRGGNGGDSNFGTLLVGGGGGGNSRSDSSTTPASAGNGGVGYVSGGGGGGGSSQTQRTGAAGGTAPSAITFLGNSYTGVAGVKGSDGSNLGDGGVGGALTESTRTSSITGTSIVYAKPGPYLVWNEADKTYGSGGAADYVYGGSNPNPTGGAGAQGVVIVRYASAANTPSLSTAVSTATGFTFNISNYDSSYTYSYSASPSATVTPGSLSGTTMPVTVSGVSPGQSSTITVSTSANGFTASSTVSGSALSNDATLSAVQIKGASATLGTPNSSLASVTAGAVTLTQIGAIDTTNSGSFVSSVTRTSASSTTKIVKYASGASTTNFNSDTTYVGTEQVSVGNFFVIRVTAQDGTTIQFYRINVTISAPVIATSSSISNAQSTPSVVITGNDFKSLIAPSDLTINVGTSGLAVSTVTRNSATQITVAFTGTASAGTLTVQAKTSAFTLAASSASNTLSIAIPHPTCSVNTHFMENKTSSPGYSIITFTSTTPCLWTAPNGVSNADVLVVAGGGGGGLGGPSGTGYEAGGGGGGGFIETLNVSLGQSSYTISVGAGGSPGNNGSNSSALGITATGGGRGGNGAGGAGGNGGSGGGGGFNQNDGGTGIAGQGFAGGKPASAGRGAGGGGASEAGDADGAGHGGDGKLSAITGSTYAGGGTGAGNPGSAAGAGGGGTSKSTTGGICSTTCNGTANTGGGGAGAYSLSNDTASAGSGGSGIVVLRYVNGEASGAAITTQPVGAASGSSLGTQPVVRIVDGNGTTVTSSTVNVVASIASGSGTLSGTTTVAAVNGVATFTNLVVTGAAGNFTLAFTPTSLAAATSNSFAITSTAVTANSLDSRVTAPVRAATPSTTAVDDTQYTGTVAWFESNGTTAAPSSFAANTVYVAKVTLTAKAGYTLTGLTGSFTHTGATSVTYSSGVVTITFAATDLTPRTISFATTSYTKAYLETQTVTATPSLGTGTITYSVGSSTACTVSGSTVTISSGTGTCSVTATVASDGTFASVTTAAPVTFTINKAVSSISLSVGTFTYTGSGLGPDTATTSGSTGALTFAYAGRGSTSYTSSPTKPTTVGTYTVTATLAADSNYASVSASADFAITSAGLVITPTISASSMVYGTSSGLPTISHTKNPNISLTTNPTCALYLASDTSFATALTISSTLAVGSYVVRCAGAAATNYTITYGTNPSFSVTKANQSAISSPVLSASSKSFPYSQTSLTVNSVSGGSGTGALSISAVADGTATGCSLSGSTLSATSAGTCTLTITKAADSNFEAATTTATFTFSKASQTITITSTAPSGAKVAGSTYTLTATGGASGNAVTFSSTTTGVCTISTATVTFVGPGTCTLAANQASATGYDAATQVTQTFTVAKGDPSLSSFANVSKTIGDSAFTLTAPTVANSLAGAFTYASGTVGTATIANSGGVGTVTIVAAGTSVITATFTPTDTTNYNSATITMTLTVNAIYTVTYQYNSATGGNSTSSSQFTQGGTAITLPTPTKTGYLFAGWFSDSGFSSRIGGAGSSYSPSGATTSITAYARWAGISTTNLVLHVDAANPASYSGSGSTWNDLSVSGNHLTFCSGSQDFLPNNRETVYGPSFSTDNGGSLNFASSLRCVTRESFNQGSNSTNLSLFMWVKPTTFANGIQTLASFRYTSSNYEAAFRFEINASGRLLFSDVGRYPQGTGFWQATSSAALTAGAWNYVGFVKSGTTGTFYVNGASSGTVRAEALTDWTQQGRFVVGLNFRQGNSQFIGSIGAIHYYTAAISAQTISSNYYESARVAIAPVNTAVPTVSGTILNGQTLTATSGTWSPGPNSYSYQWKSSSDGSTYTNISGATSNTYTLTSSENGKTLRVEVTATNDIGNSLGALSVATAASATRYTITLNRGANGTGSDQTLTKTSAVTLTLPNSATANGYFTRTGHTVTGWSTSDGGSQSHALGGSFTTDSPTTLYPVWTANTQTITYAAGTGGSGTGPSTPSSVSFGSTFTTPANTFTRTGYTFAGWSDGTNTFATAATYPATGTVSANVTLTATWTADANAVVFNNNTGAGTMTTQNIVSGTATSLSANTFTKAGYTFAGWNTNANGTSGTNYTDGQSVTITAGMTLYAKWAPNSLTVTFDSQSGSVVSNGTVATNATLTAPTAPTRAGYTFSGWSTTSTGSVVSFTGGYTHGQTANFTLYAIWSANSLTVSYNSKGGTDVTSGTVNTGASISSAPTAPTRTGYTFSAWSATDGGTAITFPYAHNQTANFTLFALWTANSLTVTYNSKGGSDVTSGSVNTGASITSAPTAPTRTGYTLSGWSATDGGTVVTFPFAHGQTASFTLFAIWAANALTVTYDSQSGSSVSNGTVNTGASIQSAPTAPTRSGYYFLGWSATTAGATVAFPYAHGQTSNFTLYAIWTIAVETTGLRINLDASNRDSLATNSRVWQSIAPGRTNVSTSSSASDTTNVTFTTNATPGFATFPTGSDGLKMFAAQLNGGASIVGTSGVTVETWIRLADNYSPSNTVQRIATHWLDSGSGQETNDSKDWNFRIVDGSLALLHSDGLTNRTVTSSVVINQKFAGQWIHVGFTWTASGTVRFYLNGTPVGAEFAGLTRGGSRTVTTAQVAIGSAPGGLIGSISKLRVYEGALTASQVLSNFDNEFDFFGLKKITFNANDGSGTPATSTQWVPGSTSKTLNSNAFTRTGYTFAGWTAAADGTGTSYTDGQSVSISSPLTIFAKWTADGNVVVFNNNSGSGTMSNQSITSGTATALTTNSFTRTGYTFAGWNTAANGSGTAYTNGQSVTITAGMTLYAQWTGTTNTVTYDSKGGSSVSNGSFVTGGSISSAPTAPTRAGYTLSGWSLTDGGSVITFPYSPTATSGITLYAVWAAISCSPTSATAGGYTIYTFTTAGTCFWTVPNGVTDVEILAVAGGGGGGYAWDNAGAGGGAGGQVRTGTATLSTTLEVTVGAGGTAGTTSSRRGGTGGNTIVSTLTALGGTGGCAARATTCSLAAQATALAGATGGAGGAGGTFGRGGGGSNTSAVAPTIATGGAGTASSFSGTSVTYGVGGAGGTNQGAGSNITGANGAANTGNGGGGASARSASGDVNGGAGSAGLVVVRVASTLTITFDSQSGSSVSNGSTLTGGAIATAPTDPTRANYTFLGWFTATTGGSAIAFPYTHGQTANFTLFARWALNTYAIAFNANNGTGTMSNQSVTHGVAASLNANLFTRANYVFHRWATNADGTGTTYNNLAEATLTAGTTLYAQWTANTYVVTFNYNSATGGNSTTSSSFTTGGSAISLPTPTRTGYTFGGWHSDAGLTTQIGSGGGTGNYSPTGTTLSLTAHAKWTPVDYTFTYNGNNSDGGTVPTETSKQIGQTATVKANTGSLTRAGYTFAGWNTQSNGSGDNYLSGALFTVQSSNVTLFAKWNANTYTITYNSNGGTGSAVRSSSNVSSDSYTTGGTSVTLPDKGTLARAGYTFGGWNTSADGSGTNRLEAATFTTVSDVIFYAKWNPITYTITYDGNTNTGGTTPTAGGYTTGQASPYTVLANSFTKTSSVFGGWNTAANGTGTSYSPGATFTTLADIVLYAIWIPQFTLHYAINGGSVTSGSLPADTLYNVNTSVAVFSSVARTGYTFAGWGNGSSTIAASGNFTIVQDSVLTARWTAIDYTISYNSDGGTTPPSSITRQIGQSYTIGNAPSKPGHDFTGWKTGNTVVGAGATIVMGSSDVTYTAQWSPKIYTISYDWNGGRGTAVSDVSYTFGTTAITLPLVGDRVRDGYNFAGWAESANGSALGLTYIPSQTRTLYALWTLGNFTVTYDAGRGTLANSTVAVPNGGSTVLPLPTRANFVFNGWHSAVTGGSRIGGNGDSFTPAASRTIYARWIQSSLFGITDSLTRIGSVITTDNVSNTFSGANSNSSVSVSVPANALPAGTTINFDLVGNSSRAVGLLPGISYVVSMAISWLTADETVPDTASGKPISVTITNSSIKAGAVAYAIVNNVSTLLGTATQDGSITVSLTSDPEVVVAATKPGAPTNVAATSNGAQQSVVSWSAPSSNGGAAITGYTVTASPGAGTCTTSGTSCTISSLTNATAYTFTVIATNSVGNSAASSAASATTAGLHAVAFDAKGGSTVASGSFLTTSTVSEPTAPTRAGYSFAGWSATDGGTAVVFPYAPGVATDITMYARWDALDNAVTFDSKGGSTVTASVFSSGGTVAEPTAPTRTGFTFAGWSATDGGTTVTFPYAPGVVTDITLYAKWNVVSSNVSGGGSNAGGNRPDPAPSAGGAPVRNNLTIVAPVTVVGVKDAKVIAVEIRVPTPESGVKPPSIKIDAASDKFIAEVKVVEGKLTLTPKTGFSGRKTVTVTITENGEDRLIQIPLIVLPEPVAKPVLTPTASNRSVIRWTESPNAEGYTVLLNGKRVCTTSATSCSVRQVLGPDAIIEIVSTGGDRTFSQRIEADFRQNVPVPITRIVSATNTKATLTRVDTKALDSVVALIRNQGFGTVVISEISTNQRTAPLAAARIAAIKRYIDDRTGNREITFEIVPPTSRTSFNNISVKG